MQETTTESAPTISTEAPGKFHSLLVNKIVYDTSNYHKYNIYTHMYIYPYILILQRTNMYFLAVARITTLPVRKVCIVARALVLVIAVLLRNA